VERERLGFRGTDRTPLSRRAKITPEQAGLPAYGGSGGSPGNPRDKGLSNLIGELSTRSERFRTWWAAHNVRFHHTGVKRSPAPLRRRAQAPRHLGRNLDQADHGPGRPVWITRRQGPFGIKALDFLERTWVTAARPVTDGTPGAGEGVLPVPRTAGPPGASQPVVGWSPGSADSRTATWPQGTGSSPVSAAAGCRSRTAAAVSAWSFADLIPGLQSFDVPGELRCGGRRDPRGTGTWSSALAKSVRVVATICSASPVLSALQLSASRMMWTALTRRWWKVENAEVLGVGVNVTEEHREGEPAQEIGHRMPLALEGSEELGDSVGARAPGVARGLRILELRVVVHPVETERLGGVLLMDQRDSLPVHGAVVALDDEVLAGPVTDELRAVSGQAAGVGTALNHERPPASAWTLGISRTAQSQGSENERCG
jgi:MmyB-like transcription regulator ligand binding domain